MANAPYGVRLLVGAATMAVEETIRLPKTILMYPMTLASTAAHVVMSRRKSADGRTRLNARSNRRRIRIEIPRRPLRALVNQVANSTRALQ